MSLRDRVEALAAQQRDRYDDADAALFAEFRAALARGEIDRIGRHLVKQVASACA